MKACSRTFAATLLLGVFATVAAAQETRRRLGPGWLHEIKYDGFRIRAHRRGRSVRLVTRNGHDLADRFPLVTTAIEELPVKSCVIDSEAKNPRQ
jgi:ATP-dependent DNA ligase